MQTCFLTVIEKKLIKEMKSIDWNRFEKMSEELIELSKESPDVTNEWFNVKIHPAKAKDELSSNSLIEALEKIYKEDK